MKHVHSCPECFDWEPCSLDCTIEPNLQLDDGTPSGHRELCVHCAPCIFRKIAYDVANAETLEDLDAVERFRRGSYLLPASEFKAYKGMLEVAEARIRLRTQYFNSLAGGASYWNLS